MDIRNIKEIVPSLEVGTYLQAMYSLSLEQLESVLLDWDWLYQYESLLHKDVYKRQVLSKTRIESYSVREDMEESSYSFFMRIPYLICSIKYYG